MQINVPQATARENARPENLIGGSVANRIDSAGESASVIRSGETNRITSGAWCARALPASTA